MRQGERFMEFLAAYVCQSVADVSKYIDMPLPVSENENLAVLVHRIEFEVNVPTAIFNAAIGVDAFLSKSQTMPTPPYIAKSEIVDSYQRMFRMWTVNDAFMDGGMGIQQAIHLFDPAILIARRTLYLHINSSATTVLNDATCRLGYTIEKVSKDAFIAALVS